jgi:hypothetical protein
MFKISKISESMGVRSAFHPTGVFAGKQQNRMDDGLWEKPFNVRR